MAKAPKALTQKDKLTKLKTLGFTGKSVKTFNATVRKTWDEFNTAFPDGKVLRKANLKPVSPEAAKVCRGANMLVIGDKLVYPAENRKVTIRETGKGVFIDEQRTTTFDGRKFTPAEQKRQPKTTIILAKDGNHLKYGRELARKAGKRQRLDNRPIMWGTLKASTFKGSKGTIKTFMRDLARLHETPEGAIIDHRYLRVEEDIERDDFESTDEYLEANAESNGTNALIRVEF